MSDTLTDKDIKILKDLSFIKAYIKKLKKKKKKKAK